MRRFVSASVSGVRSGAVVFSVTLPIFSASPSGRSASAAAWAADSPGSSSNLPITVAPRIGCGQLLAGIEADRCEALFAQLYGVQKTVRFILKVLTRDTIAAMWSSVRLKCSPRRSLRINVPPQDGVDAPKCCGDPKALGTRLG